MSDALASDAPPPEAGVENDELRAAVGRALTALAPRHQALLVGKYIESKSLREIGGELSFETAPGAGTTARLRVPLARLGDPKEDADE